MADQNANEEVHKQIEKLKANFLAHAGKAFKESKHGIISQREKEDEFMKENYNHKSWQHSVFHFIEKHTVEYFLMFLLFVDITIVIIEIYLEAIFPTCSIIENNNMICCPEVDHNHRFLATSEHDVACDASIEYICDDHNHALHTTHSVLFGCSVAILCIFEVENFLKLAILKGLFLKNSFYVLDLFVVTLSLVLDISAHSLSKIATEVASLLVVARVWRFARIVHGVYAEHVKSQKHQKDKTVEAMDDFIKGIEELVEKNFTEPK